ncbi:MAG: B3/4 domain-containing protein [Promethearchaeota archaeon]
MDLIIVSNNLAQKIPKLCLSYIKFNGISVQKKAPSVLNEYIIEVMNKIKGIYALKKIKNNEIIRKYRDFYWHYLNIDPTKTRPSSEALIRRILGNKPIPRINNIVDLNNWVSIDTLVPLGAYDLDILKIPLILRFSKQGEQFNPIGGSKKIMKGNEIILSDDNRNIIHEYPHRDSDISKLTFKTKKMLIVACGVPGIEPKILERSLNLFRDILIKSSIEQISYSKIKTIST